MILSTIGQVSADTEIVETVGIIQYRTQEDMNAKGFIASLLPTSKKECPITSAYNYLKEACQRWGGNAVVGIQITTSTATFSNGTFLYTTYTGTAVKTRKITKE